MSRTNDQIYDRLYLRMKFPPLIMDLLDCPGLLRLRDVRMANNQFFAFPAFANTSRYEHSLGVCYLSGICADHLGLPERDKTELMLAGLYHDVGTPPFAHAMEEVLQAKYGFDHEENLKNLIIGDTGEFDQDYAQIYFGQSLKLRSICQGRKARSLGIDAHRIAKIAVGDEEEELSVLINGSSMDLDNIDNICRAVSAMGIVDEEIDYKDLAIELANSFVLQDGKVLYDPSYMRYIEKWIKLRDIQYTEIYRSINDFSYQAMIKKAIRLLGEDEDISNRLNKNFWKYTDSEFTQNYLLQNKDSKQLIERVLLCKPYPCLAILYITGKGVNKYINNHIRTIESEIGNYINEEIGLTRFANQDLVIANFYPDKRHRWIPNDLWAGNTKQKNEEVWEEAAILGLFTPSKVVGYASDKNGGCRQLRRFDKKMLPDLIDKVRELLTEYEVEEYDGQNKRHITRKTK